jgi:hypothetical protein
LAGVNIFMPRRVFNLERDVRTANWVVDRIRSEETYAQNFYAALCNNNYTPKDVWGILSNITWNCTWQQAAEIISDIRQDHNPDIWHASGSNFKITDFAGFVEESYVTHEIESDINQLGWILVTRRFVDM